MPEDITRSERMRRSLRKIGYVIGGLAFAYMLLGIFAFLVQRETWPIAFLKLVAGMSLACAAFGVIFPYVWKPEEFFIKRLRPKGKTTNAQLLARAFVGSGLAGAAWALGSGLIWGLRLDAWLTVALLCGLVGGTVHLHLSQVLHLPEAASKRLQWHAGKNRDYICTPLRRVGCGTLGMPVHENATMDLAIR